MHSRLGENRLSGPRLLIVMLLGLLLAPSARGDEFAERVDLSPLNRVAVHTDGRFNSLESFAASIAREISGPHRIAGPSAIHAYFDMMIRPQVYQNAPVIHVRNKNIRATLIERLRAGTTPPSDEAVAHFERTGLIAPALLLTRDARAAIDNLRADVVRTAKFANLIDNALITMRQEMLADMLRLAPRPGAAVDEPWMTIDEFITLSAEDLGAFGEAGRLDLRQAWTSFVVGWMSRDATAVNTAAAQLADLLPVINPEVYPDQTRLGWESWYFATLGRVKLIWLLYLVSMVPLLLSVVYRWRGARLLGLALFTLGFAAHTFLFVLRWYVSGHFPNSNMYEAVTTAAWFGGLMAVICELWLGRSALRGLFAITAAGAGAAAIMATTLFPLELSAEISNRMPVLHDIWLYIHTNVIIFSYALIFMASITSVLYVGYRVITGRHDYAKVGGAASLIMTRPDGDAYLRPAKSTLGEILDGTTMVLMELSFVLLWAGIVMGAIWADHSWGRPWGWDPKEVFALNTFIVFAILIHVRMKVKDKGLWTAWIAIFGCAVMLFNWIVINFVIAGLHSYA